MGKNRVQQVIIHAQDADLGLISEQVSKFHVEIIERRLNQSQLTTAQKMDVIDEIMQILRECKSPGLN